MARSGTERRRDIEQIIWFFRAVASLFAIYQTVLRPGDDLLVNWALVGSFTVSVLVMGPLLAGSPSDRRVRGIGTAAMAIDVVVIAGILANNLTDPAEPIYLIAIFGALEAALRWSFAGGVAGGVVSGAAVAVWTAAVYARTDQTFDISYATLRGGVLLLVALFLGSIVERLNGERRTLQHTLDVSRDLIVTIDRSGTILTVNSACRDLLGFEPEEVVGRSYRHFMPDEDQGPEELPGCDLFDAGADAVLVEGRFACSDGSFRWLELNVTSVDEEQVVYVVGRDVTERRQAARRLAASEQRFRSLFDHSADAVYSFDLEGRFTSANPATERMTGYAFADLAEMGFEPLIEPSERAATRSAFDQAAGGDARTYDTIMRTRDGRLLDLHVTNLPIVVDEAVVGVYGVAKDVTERRQLERELGRQARRDALTDLPNRFALEEYLGALVADPAGGGASVLFVDLDRFKVVNDSLGHRSGDALLRVVASRIQTCLRTGDFLARWAGDEFCAVLAGRGHREVAVAVAQRLLAELEEPFSLAGREVRISASIGVAFATGATDAEQLLQQADLAMYDAKRTGRARVSLYRPGKDDGLGSRLDLEVELREALHRGGLALAYQPIVEVATGRVISLEALVRWPQADGSVLAPDSFIPLAEETGLIRQLTGWVLDEACGQLARWETRAAEGMAPLEMSVNVSALDLASPHFVEEVACALAGAGLDPHRLVLEVTESMLVADAAAAARTVQRLRDLGVRVAVDDFGAGYSSLSQLHNLPVSSFKIDRAFLDGVRPGSRGALMIASLVGLGGAFGLPVVAEGVEHAEQLAALADAGCPYAQGYFFARPESADVVVDLVGTRRVDIPVVPRRFAAAAEGASLKRAADV